MTRQWRMAAQAIVTLLVVAFLVRSVAPDWAATRGAMAELDLRPGWIVLSMVLVWLMFAGLIEGWLRVVKGWGERVPWLTGARIWILSSFGKYLPGRVWAIAGMAVMSERAGIRGRVATAAAVVMQVLAIGSGVAVALLTIGREIEAARPGTGAGMILLGVAALASLVTVGHQGILDALWRLVRREGPAPSAPRAGALVEGIVLNLVAWLGYGVAFWALARGVFPSVDLEPRLAIGGFVAAYLGGLLAIIVPGGIGVREAILVAVFGGTVGAGQAALLAAISRVVLTCCEVGAALPFILKRESAA